MSYFEWAVVAGLIGLIIQASHIVRISEQTRDNLERRLYEIDQRLEGLESIKYSAMMASEHLSSLVDRGLPDEQP